VGEKHEFECQQRDYKGKLKELRMIVQDIPHRYLVEIACRSFFSPFAKQMNHNSPEQRWAEISEHSRNFLETGWALAVRPPKVRILCSAGRSRKAKGWSICRLTIRLVKEAQDLESTIWREERVAGMVDVLADPLQSG
jgi:hypothetical protein